MSGGERQLISVRTDVVVSAMVDSLYETADARAREPLDAGAEELLALVADADRARMGWLAREAELARFERAHDRPENGLLASLTEGDLRQVAERCLALADGEPVGRPDPHDPNAVSWRIPGPGGHVRHYVALRCGDTPALKRAWIYGFLLAEARRLRVD